MSCRARIPARRGWRATRSRCTRIADHAADLEVRVGIEHFPHTALPTIAATLAFLRAVGHDNLYLLLDIGHAQMTDEDVPAAIADAGPLLGYVHLDDNDGVGDQHLALYDGILTESVAARYVRGAEGARLQRPRQPGAAPAAARPAGRAVSQPRRSPGRAGGELGGVPPERITIFREAAVASRKVIFEDANTREACSNESAWTPPFISANPALPARASRCKMCWS